MNNFLKEKNVNVYVQGKCINFLFLNWNGFIKIIKFVKIDEELNVHFFAAKKSIHIFNILITMY